MDQLGNGWRVVGGSATGHSHSKSGSGCQDSHGWAYTRDVLVVAVADGAGSRPRSAEGSAAAVRAVVSAGAALGLHRSGSPCAEEDVRALAEGLFASARQDLEALAEESECSLGDLATTMAVVLVHSGHLVVAQVGDSIVVLGDRGGDLRLVHPEDKGEYANETSFLTSDEFPDSLRIDSYPASDIDAIAASTDGLRYKLLNLAERSPYRPFYEDVFAYARRSDAVSSAVARFIADIEDDQTGDDKTLVVAIRSSVERDVKGGGQGAPTETVVNDHLHQPERAGPETPVAPVALAPTSAVDAEPVPLAQERPGRLAAALRRYVFAPRPNQAP